MAQTPHNDSFEHALDALYINDLKLLERLYELVASADDSQLKADLQRTIDETKARLTKTLGQNHPPEGGRRPR